MIIPYYPLGFVSCEVYECYITENYVNIHPDDFDGIFTYKFP